MFEDLVSKLESSGVKYTTGYDDGRDAEMLVIEVGALDKTQLLDILISANETGLEFTLTESEITVYGPNAPAEPTGPEPDYQAQALEQM